MQDTASKPSHFFQPAHQEKPAQFTSQHKKQLDEIYNKLFDYDLSEKDIEGVPPMYQSLAKHFGVRANLDPKNPKSIEMAKAFIISLVALIQMVVGAKGEIKAQEWDAIDTFLKKEFSTENSSKSGAYHDLKETAWKMVMGQTWKNLADDQVNKLIETHKHARSYFDCKGSSTGMVLLGALICAEGDGVFGPSEKHTALKMAKSLGLNDETSNQIVRLAKIETILSGINLPSKRPDYNVITELEELHKNVVNAASHTHHHGNK